MEITKVIFKKIRSGQIVALFPEIPGTKAWACDCMSYNNGHYTPMIIEAVVNARPVVKREAQPLIDELTRLGYRLEIVQRFQARHLTARKITIEQRA